MLRDLLVVLLAVLLAELLLAVLRGLLDELPAVQRLALRRDLRAAPLRILAEPAILPPRADGLQAIEPPVDLWPHLVVQKYVRDMVHSHLPAQPASPAENAPQPGVAQQVHHAGVHLD